ncbi:MAG: NAD-dependent epimerase/dehydratase family protein [Polyangia bacterium]
MNVYRRDFLQALGAGALAGCAGALVGCAGQGVRPSAASKGPATQPPSSAPPRQGPPRRILILGGTGFIGPAIVAAARARGHTLTLFNRGKTNPQLFPDVETILGERGADLGKLGGRDWDAVIDTWGRYPSGVRAAAELLRARVGHYVFISTISVYKLGRDDIDEGSPLLPTEPPPPEDMDLLHYGPLKVLSERAAQESMPGRVTVIRPGVIAGPHDPTDRFTYWPVRLQRGGEILVPDGPDYRMQFIDVRDLAEWIVTTIEARRFGTFNAVGPADPSLRAVLAACESGVAGSAQRPGRLVFVDGNWLDKSSAGGWGDFPLVVAGDADNRGFAHVSAARALAAGLRLRSPALTARDTLAFWSALPAAEQARRNAKRPGLSPEREAELLQRWRTRGTPG